MKRAIVTAGCICALLVTSGAAFSRMPSPLWSAAQEETGYVVFSHNTLENLPATHAPKQAANRISCSLARGQYESVQFGVHALRDVGSIKATVACDIPVTIYHCIDPAIKAKLAETPEEIATWMGPEVYLQKGDTVGTLLQDRSVGFWLTFRAPDNAKPGAHRGTIRIETEGRPATEVALVVNVRPFALERPRAAFGMYYREDFLPARLAAATSADAVELGIYRDMAEHGQNSLSFYNTGDFSVLPPKASFPVQRGFALARQAGLTHPDIPSMFLQHNIQLGAGGLTAAQTKPVVDWLNTQARKQGWPGIVLYTQDEPGYPSPGLRENFGPVARLPIRTGTALNATGVYAYGDIHAVWIPIGGDITPEMQSEANRQGAQVWTYSYRIWREGFIPLRQRYYAGLYTWALNLGGNYVWAYSHGHHGHAWFMPDSFDPMPITAWEARREGVDDYRYLQTLEHSIAANPKNPTAKQAAAWVKSLRDRLKSVDPHLAAAGKPLSINDYEAIRVKASAYITKLGVVSPSKFRAMPVTYVKDEAAPFRGKPLGDLRKALESTSVSRQRGAAAALFEMGPRASSAVPELAAALDSPGARIPVLRALEAIGQESYPAIASLEPLLSNKDDFLRLSATFALAGMARGTTWSDDVLGCEADDAPARAAELVPILVEHLSDPFPQVAEAAAYGLFFCGSAASESLPFAIENLEKQNTVATRIIAGLGPKAAPAVSALAARIDAAKGNDPYNCQAIASIGGAASEAVAVLEKYRSWDNPYLADVLYALVSIRGESKDLEMLSDMIGRENLPYGAGEWYSAARFLGALGGKAAPVAGRIRERLVSLDKEATLKRQLEAIYLPRISSNAKPMRLLPR